METRQTDFNAKDLLWESRRPFQERFVKSAAALSAIAQVLASHRPLDGAEDEFLQLHSEWAAPGGEIETSLQSEPFTYFWIRMAYQLLGHCLGGKALSTMAQDYSQAIGEGSGHEALKHHLDGFKALVLSSAYLTGKNVRWMTPWRVQLPFALPGTNWSLEGNHRHEIGGLEHGRLLLVRGDGVERLALEANASSSGLTVRECPTAEHAGCKVHMQPHLFCVPGWSIGNQMRPVRLDFQWQQKPKVEAALGLLAHHDPATFEHFREIMRVVALKPIVETELYSSSSTEFPGAFFSFAAHPLVMAASFIHEFRHNCLFAIEDRGSLFEESGNGLCYSPVRDDLRPFRGLFHAFYVFTSVCRFWLRILEEGELRDDTLPFVTQGTIRLRYTLKLFCGLLSSYAAFTPLGRGLFDRLVDDVDEIDARAREVGLPDDAPRLILTEEGTCEPVLSEIDGRPLSVCQSILEHIQQYDIHNQCEGLLDDILPISSLASRAA